MVMYGDNIMVVGEYHQGTSWDRIVFCCITHITISCVCMHDMWIYTYLCVYVYVHTTFFRYKELVAEALERLESKRELKRKEVCTNCSTPPLPVSHLW